MGDKQRSADQEARVRTAPQRRPVAWVPAAESGDGVVQGDIADPDAVLTIDDSPTAHFETLKVRSLQSPSHVYRAYVRSRVRLCV